MLDEAVLLGEAGPRIPPDVLPHPIFCRGTDRSTGRHCRRLIAKVERGIVVFRADGWVIPDPPSVQCKDCKTVRHFRGGVPEELGGSSGVLRQTG